LAGFLIATLGIFANRGVINATLSDRLIDSGLSWDSKVGVMGDLI
jgi:hypothetical protein